MHNAKVINAANTIVNEFTTLTANVSAGSTQISAASTTINSNGRFAGGLQPGELILIIQMHGANIHTSNTSSYGNITSYNNCGRFEFSEVASTDGGKINLTAGLLYSYTNADKVQVVRVPRYSTLTINAGASITTDAWNGTRGGIVAVETNNGAIINGSINATSLGFKGGATDILSLIFGNHAGYSSFFLWDGEEKGEGIAGTQSDYDFMNGRYARGAPANGGGGGNSHNASGGGGANCGNPASWDGRGNPSTAVAGWATAWNLESAGFSAHTSSGGGRGGYTWSSNNGNPLVTGPSNAAWGGDSRWNAGGLGGRPLASVAGRIFMGGGGGAGDGNNGVATRDGNGGGIVFILSGNGVSGTGSINSNGENAPSFIGSGSKDGVGGGGGGGSIFIYSTNGTVNGISMNAAGGNGGSSTETGTLGTEAEGLGGGGGGGYITYTAPGAPATNVSGGQNGVTNAATMTLFTPNGATAGGAGCVTLNPPNPYTTTTPLPVELILFTVIPEKKI